MGSNQEEMEKMLKDHMSEMKSLLEMHQEEILECLSVNQGKQFFVIDELDLNDELENQNFSTCLVGVCREARPVKDEPVSEPTAATGPVTEEEITAVLLHKAPVTTQELVGKFKSRLRTKEEQSAFADILRRISKIRKTNGPSYVVLRDK